jgi:argininosuccinate lyase
MKLWNIRPSAALDAAAARLNDSLPYDQRLALVDVRGSLAWVNGLAQAGILSAEEAAQIISGLEKVFAEFEQETFLFEESDEDIHTAVERRLTELVGSVGGKLHTGRSRNDQVATDFRLWVVETCAPLSASLKTLQRTLLERAEKDWGIILPGYTHFQQAQPVLLSHWWLSHFWALERDLQRLLQVRQVANVCPLGCGALAGTGFPIDRFALADALGFDSPAPNSLDATADRDFAVEFLFWAAMLGVHLSRLAEALILYSTREFGFVSLSDAYSTGSSLMPQKKNPDPLELTRGKSGVLTGKLTGLLATLKGLPSAYDKDLQEDKVPVFEAADITSLLLSVLSGLITTLTVNRDRMHAALDWQMLTTDLADYMVGKGVPFRQAHHAMAQVTRRSEALGVPLPKMPLLEWKEIHPAFEEDLFKLFDIEHCLDRRSAWGGTAPQAVKAQLAAAWEKLQAEK